MATQTHSPFETLARVIEHLDADGRSVRRTEAAAASGVDELRATLDVSIPASAGAEGVDVSGDGLSATFRAPSFPDPAASLPAAYPPVSVEPTGAAIGDAELVVTLSVVIGAGAVSEDDASRRLADEGAAARTDDGSAADSDSGGEATGGEPTSGSSADSDPEPDPLSAARDESVPAYEDTPYLRRLYEECETFDEMSRRIEMDVSAETVRRYMTDAGVHSPTSYETASDGRDGDSSAATGAEAGSELESGPADADGSGSGSGVDADTAADRESSSDPVDGATSLPDEQLVADGIGLPESLTLREVVDAVVDARTVHEVQREIGLSYDRTRRLLTQLNVLDLVMGRVGGDPDRHVTVEVVADRIRQRAPDAA